MSSPAELDTLMTSDAVVLICLITVFCSRRTIRRVANYVRQRVSTSSSFDAAMRQDTQLDALQAADRLPILASLLAVQSLSRSCDANRS